MINDSGIVREPRDYGNFTIIPNEVIEDDRLGAKALGVLVYLLSKPDNWKTNSVHLSNRFACNINTVKVILRELEGAGYLLRVRHQAPDGKFYWQSRVFDRPRDTMGQKTIDGKTIGQKTIDGKLAHITNTDSTKTDQNKNYYPLPPSELPAPEVRREEDFSQNGNGNSAGKIRTERKQAPLIRNFMDDGPWGDLARDLGLNPESVWKAFAEYLRDVHRDKGIKDLDGYCGAIESKLFNTPGLEKSNSLWQKFERHFREHRSAPITERRQNAPGCEIKLPDLPSDEEAEKGRLELKKRLSGRKSVAEVAQ